MKKLLGILVVLGSMLAMAGHGPYEYLEDRLEHTYFTVSDGARAMRIDDIKIYPAGANNIQIVLEIKGSRWDWDQMNKDGYDSYIARIVDDVKASTNTTGRVSVITILDPYKAHKEHVRQKDY